MAEDLASGGGPPPRRASDLSSLVVLLIGLALLVFPALLPQTWESIAQLVGGQMRLAWVLLAVAFLYLGTQIEEKNRLRHTLDGMMGIIREQLATRRGDRAATAFETLVSVLERPSATPDQCEKARAALSKFAGKDLGEDPAAWRAWWEEAQAKGEAPGEA